MLERQTPFGMLSLETETLVADGVGAEFMVSKAEDLTLGPKTGLSHSELRAVKFYLIRQNWESFRHRRQQVEERVPTLTSLSRLLYTSQLAVENRWKDLEVCKIPPDPFPRHTSWDNFGTSLARENGFQARSLGERYCFCVIRGASLERQFPRQDL